MSPSLPARLPAAPTAPTAPPAPTGAADRPVAASAAPAARTIDVAVPPPDRRPPAVAVAGASDLLPGMPGRRRVQLELPFSGDDLDRPVRGSEPEATEEQPLALCAVSPVPATLEEGAAKEMSAAAVGTADAVSGVPARPAPPDALQPVPGGAGLGRPADLELVPVPAPEAPRMPGWVADCLPDLEALSDALAAVEGPVERARAATAVLKVLEEARLAVVKQRAAAAHESGLGARALARALGVSLGTACDLHRLATSRPRRDSR